MILLNTRSVKLLYYIIYNLDFNHHIFHRYIFIYKFNLSPFQILTLLKNLLLSPVSLSLSLSLHTFFIFNPLLLLFAAFLLIASPLSSQSIPYTYLMYTQYICIDFVRIYHILCFIYICVCFTKI